MIKTTRKYDKSPDWFSFLSKLRLFLSENQWLLIGVAWALTYLLGLTGIVKQFKAAGEVRSFWDPFYRSFQLFFFDDSMVVSGVIHSWQLELARFLSPAVAAFTAFTALISLFRDQMQLFRLRMMQRHVVVCGIGRKGIALVRDYHNQGLRVVVIESD
ncbi:MAG: hypothetical protein WCK09_16945, partial [Bacteroidota bacterium]